MEHKIEKNIYVAGDGSVQGGIKEGGEYIKIFSLRGIGYDLEVWKGEGGHGGGDALMLEVIFNPVKKTDKYLRWADQKAGAYSLLSGVAAIKSMATGKEVLVGDLVLNLGMPDFTVMPNLIDSIPMPEKM